ncbi:MAG: heat-inducible transcriptional repressor HrcA [Clostridiales bacterium]|jgi:heat-inducible transcriptional repressor|nr:heat-inducible transcriptional repressor HrcA [Clostridiales bacterium]
MLNDRRIRILEALITEYITTAEPIGSRTIAKKYDLGVSSATVRNEMSDLYDLGLIIQPHASSGRIPSDKGYRLYVDSFMRRGELMPEQEDFLRQTIESNISHIGYLMRETAKAIAALTNYTAVAAKTSANRDKIKHIQLLPFDEKNALMVLITEGKSVKNLAVPVPRQADLQTLSAELNGAFSGAALEGGALADRAALLASRGACPPETLSAVVKVMGESSADEVYVYTSGVNNILAFPEFSNIERAKEIFNALEDKQFLLSLMTKGHGGGDLQIFIGEENDDAPMRNCSVIRGDFKAAGSFVGSIGIIGPTRMDYSQATAVLSSIVRRINTLIGAFSGDG